MLKEKSIRKLSLILLTAMVINLAFTLVSFAGDENWPWGEEPEISIMGDENWPW